MFGFNIDVMANFNFIKKICESLGKNNKSIYPMVAIATANGIFRPTFTMLKKGENPESKKYAALREGLTEVIAVPTYWACGELAAKCGKIITSKAIDKKISDLEKTGKILTTEAKNEMKSSAIKKGQAGLMLIGVCTAAGIIIPGLCSLVVKPIMEKIGKPKTSLDVTSQAPQTKTYFSVNPPAQTKTIYKNFSLGGMKVGGV